MGHPGTLPVPNMKAIEYAIKAGLAFNSEIPHETKFDRKNYFYPDLPKGYQISQYDQPCCVGGFIDVPLDDDKKRVRLRRVHLEEDAGKLVHPVGANYSLVDYNRSGTPLIEIVTEPDISSSEEAYLLAQKVQEVCRYISVSDVDMEKGHMRFDMNISLNDGDGNQVTEISEIKNLNSFRSLKKAIEFEAVRHKEAYEKGERLIHETRGWDDDKEASVSQRSKEDAPDYRYFPEPDIPKIVLSSDLVSKIKRTLPEMPEERKARFVEEYGISKKEAGTIIANKYVAEFFENTLSELIEWASTLEGKESKKDDEKKKLAKLASNWLLSELYGLMRPERVKIQEIKITAENFAELIALVYEKKVNSSAAQEILKEMFMTGNDPTHIMNEKGLKQVDDIDELSLVCDTVIQENNEVVESIKEGKESALQFLMGQVMAKTKGSANPQKVMEILKTKIIGG